MKASCKQVDGEFNIRNYFCNTKKGVFLFPKLVTGEYWWRKQGKSHSVWNLKLYIPVSKGSTDMQSLIWFTEEMASVVAAFMGKLLSISAMLLPFSVHSLISFFPSVSCTLPLLPCKWWSIWNWNAHSFIDFVIPQINSKSTSSFEVLLKTLLKFLFTKERNKMSWC